VAWLDAANGRGPHEIAVRVMKIAEETGEAVAAYIGAAGANPCKGITAGPGDLAAELCDVVLAALAALATITRRCGPPSSPSSPTRSPRPATGTGSGPGPRTTGTGWPRRCGGSSTLTWPTARLTPTPNQTSKEPVMKVTTESGALAGAVKFAARALTARAAYPVLAGLKITASADGTVEVSAFDYETSTRARAPAEVSEPGMVLAPGRLLAEITTRLPRQPADLADDGTALALTCGSTRYRLHLLPLDGYPALPELSGPAGHAEAAEFAAAVRQVTVAASRDDTLPALGAVHVTFAADALSLVTTDRYRAALRRLPWQASSGQLPSPVLIPAAALAEAAKAADGDPVSVHVLTAADGQPAMAGFGCGGQALTTRLTAGDYPDVAKLIPGEFSAIVTADAGELAEAVKRLAVVAARDTPVRLAIGPGHIELTAGSGEEADGTDTAGCELDGDPITIAFHPHRLLDALTAVGAGRARLALTTPAKPALITPADDGGQDNDAGPAYRHLLMPIRGAG
jgi:DNA polymerase-3 subunit beta